MTSNRTLTLMGASLLVIVLFFILREHWGHALGLLPYLLLLACPLMPVFHGHGGSHRGHHGSEKK